jgi:hypothetical protein
MDANTALTALATGDLLTLARSLDWAEWYMVTITPPDGFIVEGEESMTILVAVGGPVTLMCSEKLILHSHSSADAALVCYRSLVQAIDASCETARAFGGTVTVACSNDAGMPVELLAPLRDPGPFSL